MCFYKLNDDYINLEHVVRFSREYGWFSGKNTFTIKVYTLNGTFNYPMVDKEELQKEYDNLADAIKNINVSKGGKNETK